MLHGRSHFQRFLVALRKESVDRNVYTRVEQPRQVQSLSARRAWIEMPKTSPAARAVCVALRKESVDRNADPRTIKTGLKVALRKESVDRNITAMR